MKIGLLVVICLCGGMGCTSPLAIFSPEARKGIDREFDFLQWKIHPDQYDSRKVELGGRILKAAAATGHVIIVVAELPIVEHPAYGPKEGKSKGQFAIRFHRDVESCWLHPGNKIVVIGRTHGRRAIPVDDFVKNLPLIQALCLHIWKTGRDDIADYQSSGAGYGTLEEETFCSGSGADVLPSREGGFPCRRWW